MRHLLLPAWMLAMAVIISPQLAAAQNSEQKNEQSGTSQASSADTNSDKQQEQSNSNSNNSANSSQQDDKQDSPTQNNPNQNASSQNPASQNGTTNNNGPQQQNAAGQATTGNENDNSTNQAPGQNRSVLKQNSDNQNDQQSNANSQNGNRMTARGPTNIDVRRDFRFGQNSGRGLTIASVTQGSIFHRSGLRNGDIIVSYAGRPVRTQDDFVRFAVYQPGQRIPVVVLRNGREETIYVVYEETVTTGSPDARGFFGAEFDPNNNEAAVIVRVDQGGPANKAGLINGDVVVALNGNRVSSRHEALQIIGSLNPGERIQVDYTRQAKAEVILGGGRGDTKVNNATYLENDNRASVAAGVDTEQTRKVDTNRDRSNRDSQDRQDNRNGRRGILPRLRN